MHEFPRKHRPTIFKEVIGQPDAIKVLRDHVERETVPHVMLFYGPSGTGKTTLARILADKLGCPEKINGKPNPDMTEVDCSDGGVEMTRTVKRQSKLSAMLCECRIWILDEIHLLSTQGRTSLLKLLEDTPSHVYFFLCTTDPEKLPNTLRSRCTLIQLKPLSSTSIIKVIEAVLEKEKLPRPPQEVMDSLVENAQGSARQALNDLNKIINLSEEDQLEAICRPETQKQAIELARELMAPKNKRMKWLELAELIKSIDDDPETVRSLVMVYASSMLTSKAVSMHGRASLLIDEFKRMMYPPTKIGQAMLVNSCYFVFNDQTA